MKNKIAILVWTLMHATDLQNRLDPERKRFIVLHRLAPTTGQRFEKILVTDNFHRELCYATEPEKNRVNEWLGLDMRSRLVHPDSELIYL